MSENEKIEFNSFFNNTGIENLIKSIDSTLSDYDDEEHVNGLSDIYELDVADAMTRLSNGLRNIRTLAEKNDIAALSSQVDLLKEVITSHQVLLKSYVHIKNKPAQEKLSDIVHALNVIYPLFVVGLIFKNELNSQTENE